MPKLLRRPDPLVKYGEATAHVPSRDLVEIDGQKIHARGTGAGEPLILLHGFMASFFSFREIVLELGKTFRVISIDLNGFGLTERPVASDAYRIENQADLVVRVMEKLGATPGIILGHSYGAAVASVVALRHPGMVRGLILISPASRFDKLPWYMQTRPGQELLYILCRSLISDPARYREISSRAFHVEDVHTEDTSETYRQFLLVEGLRDSFFGFMKVLSGKGFARIAFEEVRHPALVLAGEKDAVIPLDECRLVAGRLPCGRLEVIPECGHSAPEECPAEVIEAIRRFVEISCSFVPSKSESHR